MTTPESGAVIATPTLPQLARTTAIALGVAAVLLVTLVLPAEYAIDPLGTGRRLGLTEIAQPRAPVAEELQAEGAPLRPTVSGPVSEYPAGFKVDTFEVTLPPYEYLEYKYHLEAGAAFAYGWEATAPLLQDFHGEREGTASDAGPREESFDKADRRRATGLLTAPFTGIHGWYWENPGSSPITIKLSSAGFYTSAVEIRSDRTRHPHPLRSLDERAVPLGNETTKTGEAR